MLGGILTTNYFIILTRRCNLRCKYCGEDATYEQPPIDLAYPLDDLLSFLQQDTSDITIQFYGGEPLLRQSLMDEIMNTIPNVKHWSVQTNATHLHQVSPSSLTKLSAILVSIDGRMKTTDANRGTGIYSQVLENCRIARKNGFSGDLVARMATSEVANIFEEVIHLANLTDPKFDHIHWQLDSQWDDDIGARWKDFTGWLEHSYNPGISKLVQWWVDEMKQGRFIGIVPFVSVMKSILYDEPSKIRCGAGVSSFAINPNGSISVCPISPEFAFSVVGHIKTSTPSSIKNSMYIGTPCTECAEFNMCGGRCLFINKTKLWGEELYGKVCNSVKHLITQLRAKKDEILFLIKTGVITKDVFDYPEYNNGCEIIP